MLRMFNYGSCCRLEVVSVYDLMKGPHLFPLSSEFSLTHVHKDPNSLHVYRYPSGTCIFNDCIYYKTEQFRHPNLKLWTMHYSSNDMPELMKQMPPLPVKLNEELVNSILPRTSLSKKSWYPRWLARAQLRVWVSGMLIYHDTIIWLVSQLKFNWNSLQV